MRYDLLIMEHHTKFLKTILARIFHADRDEEAAKFDETRETSIGTQGCLSSYCPSQNGSLTTYAS